MPGPFDVFDQNYDAWLKDRASKYNAAAAGQATPPVPQPLEAGAPPVATPKAEFKGSSDGGPDAEMKPMVDASALQAPDSNGGLFDYASWPKTGGWSRPQGAPAASVDPRDFFGAGKGNILSSLTDVDRIRDPFRYEAAMQGLQQNQLQDQQAQDRTGLDKSKLKQDATLDREKIAAGLEGQKIAAQGHVDASRMAHSPEARQSKLEDALIAGGFARGESPESIRAKIEVARNAKVFGGGSGPGSPPAGPSPAIAASSAMDAIRAVLGTAPGPEGRVGKAKPITPQIIAEVASKLPTDPEQIRLLVSQMTSNPQAVGGDIAGLGDALLRHAVRKASAISPLGTVPGSDGKVSVLGELPFVQIEDNMRPLKSFGRFIGDGGTGLGAAYNQARLESGRVVPLDSADLSGLVERSGINRDAVRQELAPLSGILAELIRSGAYK